MSMSPLHDFEDPEVGETFAEAENRVLMFGDRLFHSHVVRFAFAFLVLTLTMPPLVFRMWKSFSTQAPDVAPVFREVTPQEVPTPRGKLQDPLRHHMDLLRQTHLWELPRDGIIPPVLFDRYPPGAGKLSDVAAKKRLFLHTLLPAALLAVDEVRQERVRLNAILTDMEQCSGPETFENSGAGAQPSFADCLNREENDFLGSLFRKYRSSSLDQLRRRVNILPVSLILAQGAVESSWGASRFARAGNSIFGMWTWEEEGMVPLDRDEGKFHKVRTYDSILDSVRDYLLTINRHEAYTPLRMIRQQTLNPLALTEGLSLYSERGDDYIEELKQVIRYNNLQRFDRFKLAQMPVVTPLEVPVRP